MQETAGTTLVDAAELQELMKRKFMKAGLKEAHAEETARHLTYADACGIHSHGTVRVAYYAERIAKGGVNLDPNIVFKPTSDSTGVVDCDNGMGQYVCNVALDYAIDMAKKSGSAIVGVARTGHSGMLSYYVKRAAEEGLAAIAMCQSDPMVVPFGGSETYFGTNRLPFPHQPMVKSRLCSIWQPRCKLGARCWMRVPRTAQFRIPGQWMLKVIQPPILMMYGHYCQSPGLKVMV